MLFRSSLSMRNFDFLVLGPLGDFGTFCPEVPLSPALFVPLVIGYVLRAGGEQVVNLPLGETVNKRDGHIPIKQQALAGIRVGDVGKLVLGNAELSGQNCPVALGPGQQDHKIRVVQNVLDLPAGQQIRL